jgi:hypothetical protein
MSENSIFAIKLGHQENTLSAKPNEVCHRC